MNKRNRFVYLLITLYAVPYGGTDAGVASSFPRGPYLSVVTQTSVKVSWTTASGLPSAVQYGPTSQYTSTVLDTSITTQHSLTLTGLTSNTEYHYRCISGNDTSGDYSFYSAATMGDSFVFAVYGDTRTDHAAHAEVLRCMSQYKPRFVINSGDLVETNTVLNWDNYFADLCKTTTLGETTPFYSIVGNHENGFMYYDNLFLPSNNPANSEAYYSFDYGDIHCIGLDSEIPYAGGTAQYSWLSTDLMGPGANAARFKIAFWHRPPYSSSSHGSDLTIRNTLDPLLESNGVDIVFNGHDHTYERTNRINGTTYIVTGGGGAPLYGFSTNNSWTAYRESVHHFCLLKVDGSTLTMYMIRSSDGAIRDSLVIAKNVNGVAQDVGELPRRAELFQNYPNPFNPVTTITYEIQAPRDQSSDADFVTLKVYDVLGKEVARLVNGKQGPGLKSVRFDATGLSSGVYFYRLSIGGSVLTRMLVLLK